jgi:hypothetical protein
MFLNWVYHELGQGGFDDNDGNPLGTYEDSNGPGDDRLFWFESNLRLFFDYYDW